MSVDSNTFTQKNFFMIYFVFRIVDLISGKQEKILFQSDKGQYKSGDTVKFRVMILDQDLKVILADPDPVGSGSFLPHRSGYGSR